MPSLQGLHRVSWSESELEDHLGFRKSSLSPPEADSMLTHSVHPIDLTDPSSDKKSVAIRRPHIQPSYSILTYASSSQPLPRGASETSRGFNLPSPRKTSSFRSASTKPTTATSRYDSEDAEPDTVSLQRSHQAEFGLARYSSSDALPLGGGCRQQARLTPLARSFVSADASLGRLVAAYRILQCHALANRPRKVPPVSPATTKSQIIRQPVSQILIRNSSSIATSRAPLTTTTVRGEAEDAASEPKSPHLRFGGATENPAFTQLGQRVHPPLHRQMSGANAKEAPHRFGLQPEGRFSSVNSRGRRSLALQPPHLPAIEEALEPPDFLDDGDHGSPTHNEYIYRLKKLGGLSRRSESHMLTQAGSKESPPYQEPEVIADQSMVLVHKPDCPVHRLQMRHVHEAAAATPHFRVFSTDSPLSSFHSSFISKPLRVAAPAYVTDAIFPDWRSRRQSMERRSQRRKVRCAC